MCLRKITRGTKKDNYAFASNLFCRQVTAASHINEIRHEKD